VAQSRAIDLYERLISAAERTVAAALERELAPPVN
jgi:hypothetical protein